MDKDRLVRQINQSVTSFDEHAVIHKKMAHRLLFAVKEKMAHAEQILEIGCGTGYLTQLLIDHYPTATVTAVDLAEKMISTAKEKVEPRERVRFLTADAEQIEFSRLGSFDFIVSNVTFQWLTSPEKTICNLIRALKTEGWLMTTTYGPDTFQELREMFQRVEQEAGIQPEKHTLPLRSAEQWELLFQRTGLTHVQSIEGWHRSVFSDCRQFLESVKATGESYSEANYSVSATRRILTTVIERYNYTYRCREGVYATYHLLQIMGQKGRDSSFSFCL
ncbi:malonyl-ACP O-methyltransferase BioC [Lihuaxuella thermophila]|nr:malonyl-ACP O-methyltransferase BioC [Lihuaxuella thermophila]